MIVFTFSSTTDSAESLLTMSLKSTYYPKPISGSRLFVEPTLVTRTIDPSGAVFFSLKMSYKDLLTLLKDIAVIFIRRHFVQTIEMAITLTGQMLWSGWQTSQFGDTNNCTLKEDISTKYTFILPVQCVKCQTSYFLREVRAQAARKPGRRPIPFLFVIDVTMYQFLPNRRSWCYLQLVVRFVQ